jgi:hypothetical protein
MFLFFSLAQGDMVRQFSALVLPYGPTGHTTVRTLNLSKPFEPIFVRFLNACVISPVACVFAALPCLYPMDCYFKGIFSKFMGMHFFRPGLKPAKPLLSPHGGFARYAFNGGPTDTGSQTDQPTKRSKS